MKIHEYQGKEILRKFGVAVPRGLPVFSVDDAVKAAEELGGPVWVVKAQIHAGGRGKGGGVKVAKTLEQVREYASQILGMQLVTHQTFAMNRSRAASSRHSRVWSRLCSRVSRVRGVAWRVMVLESPSSEGITPSRPCSRHRDGRASLTLNLSSDSFLHSDTVLY